MNTRQLYNLVQQDKGQAVVIEFLQVCKLTPRGAIENMSLTSMKPRVTKDGQIVDHGIPLQVNIENGEYLLMVSRTKIVKKQTGASMRVQIIGPEGSPLTLAHGQWGNPESKGMEFWRFPQLDFIHGLHSLTFSDE